MDARRIKSAHFKRKNKRNTGDKICKVIIVGMIIVLTILVKNIVDDKLAPKPDYVQAEVINQVEDKILEVATLQAEADITKSVLEVKASKAKRFIKEIKNEIEYITLEESGDYNISHSRLNEDAGFFKKTFASSTVEVDFTYKAIFSIKTSDIMMHSSDGIAYIEYDPNEIYVKSIEVSEPITKSDKKWFGKKYSNQEVLSLVDIAKDEIYEQLNNDSTLKVKSCENLNTYFTELGEKFELDELVINNETVIEQSYNFIANGTVQYNHGNVPLEEVKYIIIHSTAMKNISAMQFYNSLDTYILDRPASAHFYVDYENVVQAIGTNLQAWHVGTKSEPFLPVYNSNSLGLEICEFENEEYQQRAIENASKFVNEVLLKQFPNAEVLTHRSVKPTLCPSILSDEQFAQYFGKEN